MIPNFTDPQFKNALLVAFKTFPVRKEMRIHLNFLALKWHFSMKDDAVFSIISAKLH